MEKANADNLQIRSRLPGAILSLRGEGLIEEVNRSCTKPSNQI
jgi:hypothetical protein